MKRENEYRLLDSRRSLPRTQMRGGKVRAGFTLVEILTTIAVIGILLAFLIPALSKVEKSAVKVKQRAQFHSIEVALEAFSTDTGDYPPSTWDVTQYGYYSASQRLAEAVVGRDGFGFHPKSQFNGTGEDSTGKSLYMDHADFNTDYPLQTDKDANLSLRKGPYLELENANAVQLSNLYGTSAVSAAQLEDTLILADIYKIAKNTVTGKMTGSPILYYRANKGKMQHDTTFVDPDPAMNQCTYNVFDSGSPMGGGIVALKPLSDKMGSHPMAGTPTARELFYNLTRNPNFPGDPTTHAGSRPYRAESFLLQSAGPDSLYGTADDVFNFDSEQ